jgi:hypothetical protein
MWDKQVIKSTKVFLGTSGAGELHTCHAWTPAGAMVGTSTGRLYSLRLQQLLREEAPLASTLRRTPDKLGKRRSVSPANVAMPNGYARAGAQPKPSTPEATQHRNPVDGLASGQLTEPDVPFTQVFTSGGPVTHLSVSRDLLVAASPGKLSWLVHGSRAAPSDVPVLFCEQSLGEGVSVLGQSVGGSNHATIVVGCSNGRISSFTSPCVPDSWTAGPDQVKAQNKVPAVTGSVLVDAHVGPVTGMVPHPSSAAVISCGEDGSMRVWDGPTGKVQACRVCPAALTCIAAAPYGMPILAVGSQTGALRLVGVATEAIDENGGQPLTVRFVDARSSCPLTQGL